ncbi:hypothetical protein SPSYN_02463 [Sporotomaculum syntrophicum]|uniref:Uncharacterized protein n=1 Tax=Sporotomaculum syntrophicum TaxID=182264 RepID=A0A9D2WNS7_9FIRM|nr:hypothetical protein SPSYN_02463 [Sporotomaculum syntrophicum]
MIFVEGLILFMLLYGGEIFISWLQLKNEEDTNE